MWKVFRFIVTELVFSSAVGVAFSSDINTYDYHHDEKASAIEIQYQKDLARYEAILAEDPEVFISSFFLSDSSIVDLDIETTFLGVRDEKFSTITFFNSKTSPEGFVLFEYAMLYDDGKLLDKGNGIIVPSENIISIINSDYELEGQIFKVNNVETHKQYIVFRIQTEGSGDFYFFDKKDLKP